MTHQSKPGPPATSGRHVPAQSTLPGCDNKKSPRQVSYRGLLHSRADSFSGYQPLTHYITDGYSCQVKIAELAGTN